MSLWTINGQSPSFYGVSVARRVQKNLLSDDVILQITQRRSVPPFAHEELVTIERDGLTWFRGWVTSSPDSIGPAEEDQTITLSGPHYWLDQILFGRKYQTFGGNAESFSLGLFLGSSFAPRVNLAAQVAEILEWCARKSGEKFTFALRSLSEITPPPRMIADMTCGEALRECLAWMPDAALVVDYSATVPAILIRPFSECATVLQSLGSAPFETASLDRQPGIAGVHLRYNSSDSLRYVDATGREDVHPPGTSGAAANVLSVTLSVDDFIPGQSFARQLFDALSPFAWRARLSFTAREVLDLSPGDQVSVENAPQHWQGHELRLSVIEQDIAHGHTSVLCNSRAHLGVRDLIDLARPFRRSRRTTTEEQLPGPEHPFCPYLVKQNGQYFLRIAPGTIRGYNQDVMPRWGGVRLNAASPPQVRFTEGFRAEYFLRVVFTPDVEQIDVSYTDPSGEPVAATVFRFMSSGTINSANVVTFEAAPRVPFLNGSQPFPGIFYFHIATPQWEAGDSPLVPRLSRNATLTDSFGVVFSPPAMFQRFT